MFVRSGCLAGGQGAQAVRGARRCVRVCTAERLAARRGSGGAVQGWARAPVARGGGRGGASPGESGRVSELKGVQAERRVERKCAGSSQTSKEDEPSAVLKPCRAKTLRPQAQGSGLRMVAVALRNNPLQLASSTIPRTGEGEGGGERMARKPRLGPPSF